MRDIEAAGRAIGRQILIVKAASEREFNAAFATVVQAHAGALLVRGKLEFRLVRVPQHGDDGGFWSELVQ